MDLENGSPVLYLKDSVGVDTVEAELFSHEPQVAHAVFQLGARVGRCAWERAAQVRRPLDGTNAAPWSLALSPGVGRPFAIVAISELGRRDSSTFAIQLSRLVSSLPDDSASAPFRGLPVVVRDAWRFQIADGVSVAVAVAVRSLNVESNPRAEIVTLVAETDTVSGNGGWRTVWTRRDAGPEDRVEGADLLAALQLRGGPAMAVFAHEGLGGLQLEFVERVAAGSWHTRWSSAALSCGPPLQE